MLKKKKRADAEIPSASLADIAFLLLIFFLVTTTIDVDTGISLVLPPPPDPTVTPPPIRERNMLKILVNAQGLILINGQPSSVQEVKPKIVEFVSNNGRNPELSDSPDKAILSLKTDNKTPYNIYIDMLDEVKGAYAELRNTEARRIFGVPFEQLTDENRKEIQRIIPMKISEAEPDKGT